jgi:hypothetical protein
METSLQQPRTTVFGMQTVRLHCVVNIEQHSPESSSFSRSEVQVSTNEMQIMSLEAFRDAIDGIVVPLITHSSNSLGITRLLSYVCTASML